MLDVTGGTGPHAGQPIARKGAPLGDAAGALILVHGRGGDAGEMLGLAELMARPVASRRRRPAALGIPTASPSRWPGTSPTCPRRSPP